jgi:hypothetical protein
VKGVEWPEVRDGLLWWLSFAELDESAVSEFDGEVLLELGWERGEGVRSLFGLGVMVALDGFFSLSLRMKELNRESR